MDDEEALKQQALRLARQHYCTGALMEGNRAYTELVSIATEQPTISLVDALKLVNVRLATEEGLAYYRNALQQLSRE